MWSDNETSEDLLGFKVHADLIVSVVNDEAVLPVTIGIFGDWGSGKSSILKMVQEKLKEDEDSLVLYFNGWVFEGYDDAKAALLESIIKGFDENEKLHEKIKDQIKKLSKSVDWMRILGFGFKNIALPVTTAYLSGGTSLVPFLAQQLSKLTEKPEELIDKLKGENAEEFLKSVIKKNKEEDHTLLVREFRNNFSEMISKSKIKKLVVIIDDLDRCTPDRIVDNLEAIKLFLNVEKTVFIIGADPRIVKQAIEYRYKATSENERIIEDYLEKLIQIPYNLPKLSDSEVETYISLLIAKKEFISKTFTKVYTAFVEFRRKNIYSVFGLTNIKGIVTGDEYQKLTKNYLALPLLASLISDSLYGNPRQIKRFLNTLILRKQLASVAQIVGFNEGVLAKLMILEYSEIELFRKLYHWQIAREGISKEVDELEKMCEDESINKIKEKIESSAYKPWSKEKIIRWINAEPKLSKIDLRDYFWLSRDKLSSSISGIGLIPPIVKALFEKMNEEIPGGVVQKLINDELLSFSDNEKESFLSLLSNMLKSNPKNKWYYDLFHYLLDATFNETEQFYIDALETISNKEIEPAVGTSMQKYKNTQLLGNYLKEYFKDNQTPAAKAFNLED